VLAGSPQGAAELVRRPLASGYFRSESGDEVDLVLERDDGQVIAVEIKAGTRALVAFQVRSIILSPFPGLRAIEALATSVPLFLLLFAGSYVVMAAMSAGNFGGRLTRTDGLYFTVTVFSTVGFGDITAKTQAARLVVTVQMIADLVMLGLAIKVIVGAVSHRRQPGDSGGT
jgi:hypothetical protein